MHGEQSEAGRAFQLFDDAAHADFRRGGHEQVDVVVRSDLHVGDTVAVLVGYLLEDGLQIRVDSVLEHLATVFRAPDDVVVQIIYRSPTMCKPFIACAHRNNCSTSTTMCIIGNALTRHWNTGFAG